MQRYTISLDDDLAVQFETWAERHGYGNRSEAIRDLVRDRLGKELFQHAKLDHCVAVVTYVYDHHERTLARRLLEDQHAHHQLSVSTLHVHLDPQRCLEVAVLRGHTGEVQAEANALVAERDVRNGMVHLIPVDPTPPHAPHSHG
ncbi:MAG: nickel-responsive transcriptional regulator NikR [Luteimonas sp.]